MSRVHNLAGGVVTGALSADRIAEGDALAVVRAVMHGLSAEEALKLAEGTADGAPTLVQIELGTMALAHPTMLDPNLPPAVLRERLRRLSALIGAGRTPVPVLPGQPGQRTGQPGRRPQPLKRQEH